MKYSRKLFKTRFKQSKAFYYLFNVVALFMRATAKRNMTESKEKTLLRFEKFLSFAFIFLEKI